MNRQPADLVIESENDFRVHGSAYTDPAIFELELERIFEQTWVYVGHESEILQPGDFRTTTIGTQPVIVSRGPDGAVNVLMNRCRHRGSIVCREERGRTAQFRCPYHGWTYRVDGRLTSIAQADGYPDDFDKLAFGLAPVPRLAIYRGLIFASLSPSGETLEERLRDVRKYVDLWADRSPTGEATLTKARHRYSYPGNWKLQMDNGVDGYHGNYAHESYVKIMERAEETSFGDFAQLRRTGYTRGLSHGDGLIDRPYGGMAGQFDYLDPALTTYHRQLEERDGAERAKALQGQQNLFVFPNLFLFEGHIRVIRPVRFDETVVELYPFELVGAPAEVNTGRLAVHERFFGPAGFGAPDDVEMFVNVWSGLKARSVDWLFMSRGMHRETRNDDGEHVCHSTDEAPQRAAYREWRRLMSGVPQPASL